MVYYFIKFPAVINAFIIKIPLNLIQNLLTYLQLSPNTWQSDFRGSSFKGMWLTFAPEPVFDFGSLKKQERNRKEELIRWKFA